MKKSILLFICLLMFIVPSAAAITFSFPSMPITGTLSSPHMSVNVSGLIPGHNYRYLFWCNNEIFGLPTVHDYNTTGDIYYNLTLPWNGVANYTVFDLPFHPEWYPYEGHLYNMTFMVIDQSTFPIGTWGIKFNWTYSTSNNDDWVYEVGLQDAYPPYLEMGAAYVVGSGFMFNGTASQRYSHADANYTTHVNYTLISLDMFLTDNSSARNVLAYGSVNLYLKNAESRLLDMYGTITDVAYGIEWLNEGFGSSLINYYSSYYVYYGVCLSGRYNSTNTHLTIDDTLYAVNFSVDKYTAGAKLCEYNGTGVGWGSAYHYNGAMVYFETNPHLTTGSGYGKGWHAPGAPNPAIMAGFNAWCASIGVPYLPLLVGFLFIIGFVSVPWRLSDKFDLRLPNFIFVIFISIGVIVDWFIGLFEAWMLALFFIVLFFSLIMKYRDEIEFAYGAIKGKPLTQRTSSAFENEYEKNIRYHLNKQPISADMGVLKRKEMSEARWVDTTAYRPGYRPKQPWSEKVLDRMKKNQQMAEGNRKIEQIKRERDISSKVTIREKTALEKQKYPKEKYGRKR